MRAFEHMDHVALADERVAVLGDVHGNSGWMRMLAKALPYLAPDVTTILQLGDWWMPAAEMDEAFAATNITAIYVTNGNHEPWGKVSRILNKHPGEAVRVSEIVWLLPRPARLSIGGRSVLSLGGASSVDRDSRIEGLTWWPDEAITDEHVATAIAGGPADLMLTHESPAGTPVRAVREILRTNPHAFPKAALEASAASRARVNEVWDTVRPELLAHGHMHVAGGGKTVDGRRVASFGREGFEGNVGILDMRTLRMITPSLRAIRAASERGYAASRCRTAAPRGKVGSSSTAAAPPTNSSKMFFAGTNDERRSQRITDGRRGRRGSTRQEHIRRGSTCLRAVPARHHHTR